MKLIISLEEAGKFVLSYYLTFYLGFPWWAFLAWLLSPDISMLGYVVNTSIGAALYNIFHHQGIAVIIGLTGLYLNQHEMMFAGLVLFGHSSMDRMMGYGLKYTDHFKHTHLGWIGKKKD